MSNRKVIVAALAAALCGISHAQDSKLSRGRQAPKPPYIQYPMPAKENR